MGTRPLLVLEGAPPDWLPDDVDVIAQEGDGLDERLTAAFTHVFGDDPGRPAVLVGMDTPQVTADDLVAAAALLRTNDAVLGPAPDGGYWLIGLRRLEPGAITGVPMSADDTFVRQVERLSSCGYRTGFAATFVDVDDAADAREVADLVPGSRFADAVRDAVGPDRAAHASRRSWRRMSVMARTVPPTVPVTLEEPSRLP